MQAITIDGGGVVYVTLDMQGRIISAYSPYYTDQLGNPMVISFGYGAASDKLVDMLTGLIALLGLTHKD